MAKIEIKSFFMIDNQFVISVKKDLEIKEVFLKYEEEAVTVPLFYDDDTKKYRFDFSVLNVEDLVAGKYTLLGNVGGDLLKFHYSNEEGIAKQDTFFFIGEKENADLQKAIYFTDYWNVKLVVGAKKVVNRLMITTPEHDLLEEIESNGMDVIIPDPNDVISKIFMIAYKDQSEMFIQSKKVDKGVRVRLADIKSTNNKRFEIWAELVNGKKVRLVNPKKKQNSLEMRYIPVQSGYIYFTVNGRLSFYNTNLPIHLLEQTSSVEVDGIKLDKSKLTVHSNKSMELMIVSDTNINDFILLGVNNTLDLETISISEGRTYSLYGRIEGTKGGFGLLRTSSVVEDSDDFSLDDEQLKLQVKKPLKLSVVVTFYNVAEYLPETLASITPSIQGLSGSEYEVLLVNDGSTDNSQVVAQEFVDRYENFKLINKVNAGLGEARNTGIDAASGEYIAFVDGDDIIAQNAYRNMLDIVEITGSDVITGGVVRLRDGYEKLSPVYRKVFNKKMFKIKFEDHPALVNDTTAWNKLYKLDFMREHNYRYPTRLYEDMELTLSVFKNANHIDVYPTTVYYWRIRDAAGNASITNSRHEISNFEERMIGVHQIHNNLIDNEILRSAYEQKVLEVDFSLYIKLLAQVHEDYQILIANEVAWAVNTFRIASLNQLSFRNKVIFSLLAMNRISETINFIGSSFSVRLDEDRKFVSKYNAALLPIFEEKISEVDILGNLKVSSLETEQNSWTIELESTLSINGDLVPINDVAVSESDSQNVVQLPIISLDESEDETVQKLKFNINDKQLSRITKIKGELFFNVGVLGIRKIIPVNVPNSYLLKNVQNFDKNGDLNGLGLSANKRVVALNYSHKDPVAVMSSSDDSIQFDLHNYIPLKDMYLENSDGERVYLRLNNSTNQYSVKKDVFKEFGRKEWALRESPVKSVAIRMLKDNTVIDLGSQAISLMVTKDLSFGFDVDYRLALAQNVSIKQEEISIRSVVTKSLVSEVMELSDVEEQVKLAIVGDKIVRQIIDVSLISTTADYIELSSTAHLDTSFVIGNGLEMKYLILDRNGRQVKDTLLRMGNIRTIGSSKNFILGQDNKRKNAPIQLSTTLTEEQVEVISRLSSSPARIQAMDYTRNQNNLSIEKNTIFYESFFGQLFTDNPYAVFKYIFDNDEQKRYEHVWVVKDYLDIQTAKKYTNEPNVRFVKYNSPEYRRYLAVAKYIVMNTSTALYFSPREGQQVLQTWHGIPLKRLGTDSNMIPGANNNVIRSFSQANLVANPDDFTQAKVVGKLDIMGIQNAKYFVGSYPRWERVMNASSEGYREWLDTQLSLNPNKKIALYAPTWRGTNGSVIDESDKMIEIYHQISQYLGSDYQVLLKAHVNAYTRLKNRNLDNVIFVPNTLDANELLSVTDILISDYSSIIFDFAITGRPVIEYMYDINQYAEYSGLYHEMVTKIPGIVATNKNSLRSALIRAKETKILDTNRLTKNKVMSDIKALTDEFLGEDIHVKTSDVSAVIVYSDEIELSPVVVAGKVNDYFEKSVNEPVVLHIGTYKSHSNINQFISNLRPGTRNMYKAVNLDLTLRDIINLETGEELGLSQEAKARIKRRILRQVFGNINVIDIDTISGIRDGDVETKLILDVIK